MRISVGLVPFAGLIVLLAAPAAAAPITFAYEGTVTVDRSGHHAAGETLFVSVTVDPAISRATRPDAMTVRYPAAITAMTVRLMDTSWHHANPAGFGDVLVAAEPGNETLLIDAADLTAAGFGAFDGPALSGRPLTGLLVAFQVLPGDGASSDGTSRDASNIFRDPLLTGEAPDPARFSSTLISLFTGGPRPVLAATPVRAVPVPDLLYDGPAIASPASHR